MPDAIGTRLKEGEDWGWLTIQKDPMQTQEAT
jgi:hypothetical protein